MDSLDCSACLPLDELGNLLSEALSLQSAVEGHFLLVVLRRHFWAHQVESELYLWKEMSQLRKIVCLEEQPLLSFFRSAHHNEGEIFLVEKLQLLDKEGNSHWKRQAITLVRFKV